MPRPEVIGGLVCATVAPGIMTIGFFIWDSTWTGSSVYLNGFKGVVAGALFVAVICASAVCFDQHLIPRIPLMNWLCVWLSSLLGVVVGDTCWLMALARIGARKVMVIDGTKPFLAAALGAAVLGESCGWLLLLGASITTAGVLIVALDVDGASESGSAPERASRRGGFASEGQPASASDREHEAPDRPDPRADSAPRHAHCGCPPSRVPPFSAGDCSPEAGAPPTDVKCAPPGARPPAPASDAEPVPVGVDCGSLSLCMLALVGNRHRGASTAPVEHRLASKSPGAFVVGGNSETLADALEARADGTPWEVEGVGRAVVEEWAHSDEPAQTGAWRRSAPDLVGAPGSCAGLPAVGAHGGSLEEVDARCAGKLAATTMPRGTGAELPQQSDGARICIGYLSSVANCLFDVVGVALVKQFGRSLSTFHINAVRFGVSGLEIMLVILSARLWWRLHRRPVPAWAVAPKLARRGWGMMLVAIFFATFLCPSMSQFAVFHIEMAVYTTLISLGPIWALLASYFMYGKSVSMASLLGSALAVAGVFPLVLSQDDSPAA